MMFRYLMLIVMAGSVLGCSTGGNRIPTSNPSATIHGIAVESDSLIIGDIFVANPDLIQSAGANHFTTSCDGQTCTIAYPENLGAGWNLPEMESTVETFHGGRHVVEAQWNETIHGVPLGVNSGIDLTNPSISFMSHGGWMEYAYFATDTVSINDNVYWGYAFSIGDDTGSNPVGSATWEGAMVGGFFEESSPGSGDRGHRVQGEATLTFWLADATLDAAFTNIVDISVQLSEHSPHPHPRHPSMYWEDLTVQDGRFRREGSEGHFIQGQFYGPNHQEVGGIFEHNNNIAGAFGARRQ